MGGFYGLCFTSAFLYLLVIYSTYTFKDTCKFVLFKKLMLVDGKEEELDIYNFYGLLRNPEAAPRVLRDYLFKIPRHKGLQNFNVRQNHCGALVNKMQISGP